MDELLELIIRAIVALFEGGSSAPKPQPPPFRPAGPGALQHRPPAPGSSRQPPPLNPRLQHAQQLMAQRQQQLEQRQRMAPARRGPVPLPPPVKPPSRSMPTPKPAPAQQVTETPATATHAPAPAAITADAIRQLIRTRPSATRTMWVLSEVFGPPVGLRQGHERP